MKTTRILGFIAGILAAIALVAIGLGLIFTMNPSFGSDLMKFGYESLLAGMAVVAVSLVPGIAHLLLRIKFRRPYARRRGPRGFLIVSRVLVWIWGVSVLAVLGLVLYMTPMLVSLIAR